MSEPNKPEEASTEISRDEMLSALFAQMVVQQANLAMMLLGRVPHPTTGATMQDIEGARMFIDQLEMLDVKTKGNLTREEEALLKQSLMTLRLAFVETIEKPASPPGDHPKAEPTAPPAQSESRISPGEPETTSESDPKKKFSKKY